MITLRTPTAKLFGVLLAYLPLRFVIYFLSIKLGLPHANIIELVSELYIGLAGIYLLFTNFPRAWAKLKSPRQWPLVIKLSIALVAWGLASLSYTPAGFAQALRGLRLDFLGLGILVLLWLVPIETKERQPIFELARWICLLVAAIGVFELIFGPGIFRVLGYVPYQFFAGKIRQVHSLLPTPNMFGSAMVVLTALIYKRSAKVGWWLAGGLGILVGSSYSRSAWLAFAVFGALMFFYQLRRGVFTWSIGFMAIGLIVGIGFGIVRYHGSLDSAATHDASTSQHQEAFEGAERGLTTFGEEWFIGDGVGSAGPATFNSKQPVRISESWYIQLFQEVGMVGLVLFVAIIVVLVNQLLTAGEPVLAFLAVALSINALFLHIWADDRFVHILFWTLMGIVLFALPKPKKAATA